jgi:RNA 2',3'-cyclic 3'-phosphodiesterase
MPRLFTGLEVPAEIGQTLSSLRGGLPGARWVDPENYHVTLRFIGDIDGVSANEIASMLARVDRKPFDVTVQGLSSFGGRKPRAVVANIAPTRPLIELQAELERLMQRIGLDPEGRKFTPHATPRARMSPTTSRCAAISRAGCSPPIASCCSPRAPRPAAVPTWSRIPTRFVRDSRSSPGRNGERRRRIPPAPISRLAFLCVLGS